MVAGDSVVEFIDKGNGSRTIHRRHSRSNSLFIFTTFQLRHDDTPYTAERSFSHCMLYLGSLYVGTQNARRAGDKEGVCC